MDHKGQSKLGLQVFPVCFEITYDVFEVQTRVRLRLASIGLISTIMDPRMIGISLQNFSVLIVHWMRMHIIVVKQAEELCMFILSIPQLKRAAR